MNDTKHKRAIILVVVFCLAALTVGGLLFAISSSSASRGTQGATRFYRMDETAASHPFTTLAGSAAYDRSTFIDLAPLFLEHEGVYVSVCKGYAIKLADDDLATALGLGADGDPARRGPNLYCENGTARVIYGAQLNSASIADYVFKVDGTWYMAWFSSSYSRQMLHLLGIIARG